MNNLYLISENVPDAIVTKIEQLNEDLKNQNIYSFIYCGYPLINIDEKQTVMKGLAITQKGIFILYETDEERNDYLRDLIKTIMDSSSLSQYYLNQSIKIDTICIDDDDRIINKILGKNYNIEINIVDCLNESVQYIQRLTENEERIIKNERSLGAKIKERETKAKRFDETQFETLYKDNNMNLRVRGLAGSGKTILLVKKLAFLHYKNRELKLAYVFYTKSLKQYIINMFKDFYKEFEKIREPDMSKIFIVHSWGNDNIPGFYYNICKQFNIEYKTYNDCNFENACLDCINNLPKGRLNLFDYVFIDEAQDFRINFYNLARKSLCPLGKLIYAYDELQTLNENASKMPTKKEIFGDDDCKDKNLKYCYRSPNEILVSAHALGLGIYHKNLKGITEFINYVDDLDVLKGVGYIEEQGKLKPNCDVVLKREDNIINQEYDKIVTFKGGVLEQYRFVCNEIDNLLRKEDVTPNDILIIDLDAIKVRENFMMFRDILWGMTDDKGNHLYDTNLVDKDKALSFRLKGSIPYTTIFRAKGNEANIVFIVNSNKLNVVEMYNRNRIFTAMTRAKFKVYILGDGIYMDNIIRELSDVKDNNYMLKFKCLSSSEQKDFKNRLYQDSKKADDMQKVLEILHKYSGDSDIYLKILQEQGNPENILAKLIENKDN